MIRAHKHAHTHTHTHMDDKLALIHYYIYGNKCARCMSLFRLIAIVSKEKLVFLTVIYASVAAQQTRRGGGTLNDATELRRRSH